MSREEIISRLHRMTVASCGAVAILVCSLPGIGFVENGRYTSDQLFGQQQTTQSAAQEQIVFFSFPIGVETAPILASPSQDAYQTGVVSRGDEVEIYFKNEKGYCAIRPPQGSFSWVNGKFIELESDGYGRVVSPSSKAVPSRVGAPTPKASSVAQIGLKPDQRVRILEKTQLQNGSVWYKIAPPPGEFRWVHESNLSRTSALAQLPPKIMTRSEFLKSLNALDGKNEGSGAVARRPYSGSFQSVADIEGARQLVAPSSVAATYDREAFNQAFAKLNADVFQILQKNKPSNEELTALQARAEELFDRAPNDEERRLVQTTFDAITKAQIAMQRAGVGTPNSVQFPTDVDHYAGVIAPTTVPFGVPNGRQIIPSFPNGRNLDGLPIVDGQIVGMPPIIDGAYVLDAAVVGDAPDVAKVEKESKPKSRLGFAFSRSNNPFRKEPRDPTSPKPKSTISRMESSLAHLPGLQTDQTTEIVPPQNYSFNKRGVPTRSFANAQLAPGPLRKDVTQGDAVVSVPSTQSSSLQTRQGALVFQAPRIGEGGSSANAGAADFEPQPTAASNWSSVASDVRVAKQSSALPTAYEEPQNKTKGIRSAAAFAPITSKSFDDFDATGVLVELSNVSDGAPRYALLNSVGDSFEIAAYVAPGKNVTFDRFVGQRVVVKGVSGTVAVNEKTQKHIVVSSLFLLK